MAHRERPVLLRAPRPGPRACEDGEREVGLTHAGRRQVVWNHDDVPLVEKPDAVRNHCSQTLCALDARDILLPSPRVNCVVGARPRRGQVGEERLVLRSIDFGGGCIRCVVRRTGQGCRAAAQRQPHCLNVIMCCLKNDKCDWSICSHVNRLISLALKRDICILRRRKLVDCTLDAVLWGHCVVGCGCLRHSEGIWAPEKLGVRHLGGWCGSGALRHG